MAFTFSLMKYVTTIGIMNPVDRLNTVTIDDIVPEKLGAISCKFMYVVIEQAPLNPYETVINAMHQYG